MKPVVSLGTQDFRKIRENGSFYIDKTALIKEWWESQDDVTLITRPRRFGKTLNMSMIEYFFSCEYADRSDLFEGLSVWQDEKYRGLQGSYPVIFMSFAGIKGNTYEAAREGIIQLLVKLYGKYDYLRKAEFMTSQDLEYFNSVGLDMTDTTASLAVYSLADYLSRSCGKKVIILLDEYDTPLQEAYVYDYWNELTSFIRSLFNSTFKTNPYMERGLLTGITRVSRESIFSDLNNLTIVSTTSGKYCTQFGFLEEEVFRALDLFGLGNSKETVKNWYDGFTFGNRMDVYNPWSITNFLDEKLFRPYWANSSSNKLVSNLIQRGNPRIKMVMEDLLKGKQLITELDEEVIFDQLQKKHSAVWSLLLASGYLKAVNRSFNESTGRFTYCLELTNREVKMMFEDMVKEWFSDETVSLNDFLSALLSSDVDYMNVYMNQVAEEMFSSFDVGNKPSDDANPERFYHGFVLGLIVELAGIYKVSSNRESGFGRYDVMLEPLNNQMPAFVLEFKVRNPRKEKALEDTLKAALLQIEDRRYDTELLTRGIPKENIRHYGFVFEGKRVLIG